MIRLISILFIFPFTLFSQESKTEKDTIFLDAHWNNTDFRSQAKYYRELSSYSKDSIIEVRDYYLETGNIQMIGTYHGKLNRTNQTGEFKYFYPNGNLKAIYDYSGGIVNGRLEKYYENGKLKSTEKYDLGTQIDTIRYFYENGQLQRMEVINPNYNSNIEAETYKRILLIEAFEKDGTPQVEDGYGIYTEYFLSGKKRISTRYLAGFPHGKMIIYKGQKKKPSCIMTFKHGKFIKGELHDNGKKDIFGSINRKAYYPTGMRGLEDFIKINLGDCDDKNDLEFIIMVSISTEGLVSFEQIISGDASPCQLEEIQMLVRNMPIWAPAIENGRYVDTDQAIRIEYK